jgi:hypothetical protein
MIPGGESKGELGKESIIYKIFTKRACKERPPKMFRSEKENPPVGEKRTFPIYLALP